MTLYHPRISSEKSSLFRTVIKLSVLILVKQVTINIVNILKELKKNKLRARDTGDRFLTVLYGVVIR